MCQVGGPRCSSHAKDDLKKAKREFVNTKIRKDETEEDQKARESARNKMYKAMKVYYSTPAGQKELGRELERARAEGNEKAEKVNGELLRQGVALRKKLVAQGREYREKRGLDKQPLVNGFDSNGRFVQTNTYYDDDGYDVNGENKDGIKREVIEEQERLAKEDKQADSLPPRIVHLGK